MKKGFCALLIALCLTLSLFPITALAATTPADVNQNTVNERIEKLKTALVGKYFTVAGSGACTNHNGAGCANCAMMYTVRSSWMQKAVDLVPSSNNSSPFEFYYDDWSMVRGTTCVGFANFAGWYIFAQKSTDTVEFEKVTHSLFTAATLEQAMPGDIIAFGKGNDFYHSGIYLSHDNSGVNVLDCNYGTRYIIREHRISYNNADGWKNVTISRAKNYDMTLPDPPKGIEYTSDTALAAKLDYIFSTYKPGSVFPATAAVDGIDIGVSSGNLYARGYQFARWCFYKLFGYVDSVERGESGKYTFTELLTHSQGKNNSVDKLASLLKEGLNGTTCGSHLRVSYYRSFIVLKVNKNGITVMDADKNGDGKVWVYDLTYTELAEIVKAAHERFPKNNDINVFLHQPVIPPKTFSVTFSAGSGVVSPASITVTDGQAYGPLPTPTCSGYEFQGWYTSPNGGSKITSSSVVTTTADHTLYAHWEKVDPTEGRLPFVDIQTYPTSFFSDIGFGEWYDENVIGVYRLGLMRGVGDSRFAPEDNVTIAEAVTMAARLHNTYYGNGEKFEPYDGGNWYDPYVNYIKKNGLLAENYNYDKPATREQFAHILACAFPDEALTPLRTSAPSFTDAGSIVYRGDVNRLYMAGVINGSLDAGVLSFKPQDTITRAEAAAIVTRMAKPALRIS